MTRSRRYWLRPTGAVAAASMVLMTGCGPSEEEIEERIERAVQEAGQEWREQYHELAASERAVKAKLDAIAEHMVSSGDVGTEVLKIDYGLPSLNSEVYRRGDVVIAKPPSLNEGWMHTCCQFYTVKTADGDTFWVEFAMTTWFGDKGVDGNSYTAANSKTRLFQSDDQKGWRERYFGLQQRVDAELAGSVLPASESP